MVEFVIQCPQYFYEQQSGEMRKMVKNVAIVSLSRGIIGEQFVQFEVEIGLRRLKEYGLNVKLMPNACK